MSDDITSLKVQVHGFVQGIGFRDFLVMAAEAQKLDGWVRNRSDGTVEALVSGPTKAVEIFVTNATKGPPGAKVSTETFKGLTLLARYGHVAQGGPSDQHENELRLVLYYQLR